MLRSIILISALLTACQLTYSQENRIKLVRADALKFDESIGNEAQRLIGNVKFTHKGAIMYCDSAYLYSVSNSLDAFGNVRVVQGDTLNLTSEKLYYNGNTRLIKVRDAVTLRDKKMTLETNTLDFNRATGIAVYYDTGIITSKVNDNKLISCEGVYNSNTEFFHFRDSVSLVNPDYTVETDTLDYNNQTEVAYFSGPTFIFSDENTIYCENGWYDTKNDLAQFEEDAFIDNGSQLLKGDSLWYSRNEGLGKAYYNVSIADTADKYIIYGDFGSYNEATGKTLVTGQAEMIQYDEQDSLFLHADTLDAVRDSIFGDKVHAYHQVKFFRSDIQGAADSLVFSERDSMIYMYRDPVLWSENLQITGDTIRLKTYGGISERLFVYEHAFMINEIDTSHYNQIKGKRLTGYFNNNDIYKILIEGNGESLYYALEEEEKRDSLQTQSDTIAREPEFIGVNKAICSNIVIYLENQQVQRIMFLTKPDGAFHPVEKFPEDEKYFDGFSWQISRRPNNRWEIFAISSDE
jgi:lipopolysaccharide export system protein LptA